jgi:hypothetical protein
MDSLRIALYAPNKTLRPTARTSGRGRARFVRSMIRRLSRLLLLAASIACPAYSAELWEGVELERDGVLIASPEAQCRQLRAKLRRNISSKTTFRQAIQILGPGYIPEMSSAGGIRWYFKDEKYYDTGLHPQGLDVPFSARLERGTPVGCGE